MEREVAGDERPSLSWLRILRVRRAEALTDSCYTGCNYSSWPWSNPISVDDCEIAAIERIASSGLRAEPWPYLELGQKIRIESDALMGLEGILINFKGNHRIIVSVSLLRRSVALEIDRCCVRPVSPARVTNLEPITTHPLLQGVVV